MPTINRRHEIKGLLILVALAACASGCARTSGQNASTPPSSSAPGTPAAPSVRTARPRAIAMDRSETSSSRQLQVSSPTILPQVAIPLRHTAYGDNVQPALSWTAVPGARSYALLLEDPDAPTPQPFLHWIAWNIPASVHALPERLAAQPTLSAPAGMQQGRNGTGASGYFGPHPPAGDRPHHYHFEVLALDRMLQLPPDADREALLGAAGSHVLAKGELVASFAKP